MKVTIKGFGNRWISVQADSVNHGRIVDTILEVPNCWRCIRVGDIRGPAVMVSFSYDHDNYRAPGWAVKIELLRKDVPFPGKITVDAEGNSPVVIVDCPNDVPVADYGGKALV